MMEVYSQATTIDEIAETLKGLANDTSGATVAENIGLIKSLGESRYLVGILGQILADDSLLAAVAARSYPHVNLFDKIVLVNGEKPDAYRLTLHFWRPPYTEGELNQELIHEHRFNFWSTVLIGTLVSENFEKAATGRTLRQYRYVPEKARTHDFLDFYDFGGECRLQNIGQKTKAAGEA